MNFELASLIVEILIGVGWIGVIYYGISRYEKSNDRICAALEERHAKTMAALKAQIRGLETQDQALRDQGQALQTVTARTGGSGTA